MRSEVACRKLAEDLFSGFSQMDQVRLLAESKLSKKTVTIAPLFDLQSGDQDASMRSCDATLAARAASVQTLWEVRPWGIDELARSSYAIVPASESANAAAGAPGQRLRAVLVDTKSGKVLARAGASALGEAAAHVPTPFFRDSPVLVRDDYLDSHRATLESSGADAHPRLLQDLRVRAQLAQPIELYNRERYPEALREFKQVAATPQGQGLTTQVGIYVSGTQVGAEQDVARAADRIVERGLDVKRVEFKIFFRPGSDVPFSRPPFDTMRLVPGVARKMATSNVCLVVVGHTSRTGTAEYNKQLSQRRADYIVQQLVRVNPSVRTRVSSEGRGFEQNIIGNGRDDDTDLADRRVEFIVRNC